MALLNFQKQFAPDVESGKKKQTIRSPRKHPIKEGETLYLYTGLRTKQARKLGEVECNTVYDIKIAAWGFQMDPYTLTVLEDLDNIARADGFKDWEEMVTWFEKTHGLPFIGTLITWK